MFDLIFSNQFFWDVPLHPIAFLIPLPINEIDNTFLKNVCIYIIAIYLLNHCFLSSFPMLSPWKRLENQEGFGHEQALTPNILPYIIKRNECNMKPYNNWMWTKYKYLKQSWSLAKLSLTKRCYKNFVYEIVCTKNLKTFLQIVLPYTTKVPKCFNK